MTGASPKEVRIESLAFGGDGVGRGADGRVVFVPGTVPGETVLVDVIARKKGYDRAELREIRVSSEERIEPRCRYCAAGCGGCQWQHVALSRQRAAKQYIVLGALRQLDAGVEPISCPVPEYRWRRRVRIHYQAGQVGFLAQRSHALVDIDSCPQMDEALERTFVALRGVGFQGTGTVELLSGARGAVHAVVSARQDRSFHDKVAKMIEAGTLAGIAIGEQELGTQMVDLDGGPPFWGAASVFAQASADGNRELVRLVLEHVGELTGLRVLELFAGSGNFTRGLARLAKSVTAVEENPPSFVKENLGGCADLRAQSAEAAVRNLSGQGFDVLVLDPPRSGLSRELRRALPHLGVERVVYVSCDPMTLARDLVALEEGGYRLERVSPVDMMPGTYHVEIVASLGLRAR